MRLRDLLLSTRTVDATVLAQAEAHALQVQRPVANVLVAFNVVDGSRLARLLSRALRYEFIDVMAIEVHPRLLEVVPRHAADRYRVLPIGVKPGVAGSLLYLGMSDPTDEETIRTVETATGLRVEPLVCDDAALQRSLDKHYGLVLNAGALVGTLIADARQPNPEFLTESTAEALRYVQGVRSADEPTVDVNVPRRGVGPPAHQPPEEPTREVARIDVLAEPTRADDGRVATAPRQRLSALGEPTLVPGEPIEDDEPFDERTDPDRVRAPAPVFFTPTRSQAATDLPRVIVAMHQVSSGLRDELAGLIGDVVVVDDDVEACRMAVGQAALVLVGVSRRSALLRALLDLEDLPTRPRVVVVGGDPGLRLIACVDHAVDEPAEERAVAVAILAGLRHAGVDV
jgi:hypothetical protein